MARFEPFSDARIDDTLILGGIIFVNCNGLPRREAPKGYGPYTMLYNG